MAGVDLLQIDHHSLNVEPKTGVAHERRLVLPPVMRGPVSGHQSQLALQSVVGGCYKLRCPGQEVPRISQRVPDRGR